MNVAGRVLSRREFCSLVSGALQPTGIELIRFSVRTGPTESIESTGSISMSGVALVEVQASTLWGACAPRSCSLLGRGSAFLVCFSLVVGGSRDYRAVQDPRVRVGVVDVDGLLAASLCRDL